LLFWLGRLRDVTCAEQLAAAARVLSEHLRVKFVVMGHTHEPMARPAREGRDAWYLNTGTWIPPARRPRHQGACDCRFTHLAVVSGDAGARAHLLRWCGAARRPERIEDVG